MKKSVSVFLLSAMILGMFASCSESEINTPENTDTQNAEVMADEIPDTVIEETEEEEPLDIEVKDYGGRTINIVLAGNWSFNDFIAEEMTPFVVYCQDFFRSFL